MGEKSEIPAILPQATRGIFVPFFILHRFGVETYIRGKPGSSAFLRAVRPESKKIEKRKKEEKKKKKKKNEGPKERNYSYFGHPNTATKLLYWISAPRIQF